MRKVRIVNYIDGKYHWEGIPIFDYIKKFIEPIKLIGNKFITNYPDGNNAIIGPLFGWYGTKDWGGLGRKFRDSKHPEKMKNWGKGWQK